MEREMPVACCHTVFTAEERMAYKRIWDQLTSKRLGITELVDGFQYAFPGDSDTLLLIQEWVSLERRCCPFLTFSIIVNHEGEPMKLQLTGGEEAKAFLRMDLDASMNRIMS